MNFLRTMAKQTKYGNEPIVRDGVRYDSKAELTYKGRLDMRQRAGEITGYDYHVPVPLLAPGGELIGYYEIDFKVYFPDGREEWHDVKAKGQQTALFTWKKKHVKAQYGVDIVRIDSKTFQPF